MFHDVLLDSVAVAAVPGEREGPLLPRAAHLRGQGPEGERRNNVPTCEQVEDYYVFKR